MVPCLCLAGRDRELSINVFIEVTEHVLFTLVTVEGVVLG